MKQSQLKKILQVLDKLNQEIDVLGNSVLKTPLKPMPIPVRTNKRL